MVTVTTLSKDYPVGKNVVHALKSASFECEKKTMTLLMGPSGSGKSTALKVIGGILRATSGSIEVDGINVEKLNDNELCDYRYLTVGHVFQDFRLLEHLSIMDNILLGVRVGDKKIRKDGKEQVEFAKELVEYLGLSDALLQDVSELSGGQKQRVAIARALVKKPSVILADEPTASLDKENAILITELIKKITIDFNTVTIIATHDARLKDYADQCLMFNDGVVT